MLDMWRVVISAGSGVRAAVRFCFVGKAERTKLQTRVGSDHANV